MDKPWSAACERNRDPILAVLRERFAGCKRVLEIGSGTGQHAVHFAAALPHLTWQTSDVAAHLPGLRMWLDEAGLPNTPAPLAIDVNEPLPQGEFDAVFSANTLHIMSWPEVQRMFAGLPRLMKPGALLTVYGPFNTNGQYTSAGNATFDAALRDGDPQRGIRDFDAVNSLARHVGLALVEDRDMPANNRCITWMKA